VTNPDQITRGFLAAALGGDQILDPFLDPVVAQAGRALVEVVAQPFALVVGDLAVEHRPHLPDDHRAVGVAGIGVVIVIEAHDDTSSSLGASWD
jgi:hypothetical protein